LHDRIRYKIKGGIIVEKIQKVDRQWLKDLRHEKRMTVREASKEMGMSFSYYSDLENGRRNPSVEKSYIMADFYGVDVQLFLTNRVRFSEKVH
jgi:transcriptional regulator with XRE-family HTH domain